jgi:ERCC4-type nuclease
MSGLILIDTREQDLHIAKQLDIYGIKYERKKLDFGDYSFVADGKSYERQIVIERKGSIDELIGNFTKGRDRFRREFERAKGCKVILMVEASVEQLEKGQYRSRMSPKDLKSFLSTWRNKFQLDLQFVEKSHSCVFILNTFGEFYKFTHGGKK